MQGQRSFVGTLPENISFDHGSTSRDASLDSLVPWNNMQNTTETWLPEYRIPSSETNSQYLHHIGHSEWSSGETSSGAGRSQAERNERKREHTFSIHSRDAITLEECPLESSNILSIDNVDVNGHGYQTSNRLSPMHISGPDSVSQDINICSEFGKQEDDDCQVIEHPDRPISLGSSNEKRPAIGGSSDALGMSSGCGGHMMEDYRPECSLDGRRLSCKRKALEIQIGHPSGAGSSNFFEHAERNQWHAVTSAQISAANVSMPTPAPAANNLLFRNGPEQANSSIRLGVRVPVSSNPLSLNARGAAESSHRNFRLRISGSHQLDRIPGNPFSTEVNVGNSDVSSSRHASRLAHRNSLFDLNPTLPMENGSHHGQPPVLSHVPSMRRTPHSRWSGASTSRTNTSSSAAIALDRERERDPLLYEESASGNIPRSILEHPMFVPASEMGGSSHLPTNWNLAGWNNIIGGDVASTSQAGSTSRVNSASASPFWSHRSHPPYPRRLLEIVQRTLLSAAGTESRGQSSSSAIRSSSPGRSQETTLLSGSGNRGPHSSNTRSALLERHLDGASGIPYSLRSLAAASEGRSSVMSEIRHVLDLMRRGESLRFEDMMMLDHSVFIGMADMHDRHRDMRLDIDNMSYEELLALEDCIGNVCTGLDEESVLSRLKQWKYAERGDDGETEPCSICREEYKDGEDIGSLECGHDFHRDCIKQWLLHKNLCPICKTTGLSV